MNQPGQPLSLEDRVDPLISLREFEESKSHNHVIHRPLSGTVVLVGRLDNRSEPYNVVECQHEVGGGVNWRGKGIRGAKFDIIICRSILQGSRLTGAGLGFLLFE